MLSTKTIVVLGSAYGGPRAAQILVAGLPADWRVLLIDRNSHTNNVYILPRYSVLPGHEHKAFIANTKVFLTKEPPLLHHRLQANVTSIGLKSIMISKAFPEHGITTCEVLYDYMVYALGSYLPAPLNLWGDGLPRDRQGHSKLPLYCGMKTEGIAWLNAHQEIVDASSTVLVVGGGALGIQFATDIASVHAEKSVTLLHSRTRLLPRFDETMHTETLNVLKSMDNVTVILGERLDSSSLEEGKTNKHGQRIVRTVAGREIAADLILLCIGQKPNTGLLKDLDPRTVNPEDSLARVLRTMQLAVMPRSSTGNNGHGSRSVNTPPSDLPLTFKHQNTPYPHIFVIGDAADAFGAIDAGHNAYYQGEVAARNIIRLVTKAEGGACEPLEEYTPHPPMIKVSLGLGKAVVQTRPGVVARKDGEPDDLDAAKMWPLFGITIVNDDQMYE